MSDRQAVRALIASVIVISLVGCNAASIASDSPPPTSPAPSMEPTQSPSPAALTPSPSSTAAQSSPTSVPSPTSPPTATPAPSATPERWTLVGISDSMVGGDPGDIGNRYARLTETELGVDVSIHWYFFGGSTSQYVLTQVRSNTALRDAVRSADLVAFNVPIGALKDLCPWDGASYSPAAGSAREYRQCGAAMAAAYAADSEAIMAEIDALRRSDALVRTTNTYVPFYRRFQDLGLLDVVIDNFRSINAGFEAAAQAHGIPFVDAFKAFMGADGTADPMAAGLLSDDQLHATPAGGQRLAELWRDLGYAPRR